MGQKNLTAAEIMKMLEADGWVCVRFHGSHRQYRHRTKPGRVTVSMHKGSIALGTLRSIFRQAGWRW